MSILDKILNQPLLDTDLYKDLNWTEISSNPVESYLKLQKCLAEGYTYEDFIKYGEMFTPLKPRNLPAVTKK